MGHSAIWAGHSAAYGAVSQTFARPADPGAVGGVAFPVNWMDEETKTRFVSGLNIGEEERNGSMLQIETDEIQIFLFSTVQIHFHSLNWLFFVLVCI